MGSWKGIHIQVWGGKREQKRKSDRYQGSFRSEKRCNGAGFFPVTIAATLRWKGFCRYKVSSLHALSCRKRQEPKRQDQENKRQDRQDHETRSTRPTRPRQYQQEDHDNDHDQDRQDQETTATRPKDRTRRPGNKIAEHQTTFNRHHHSMQALCYCWCCDYVGWKLFLLFGAVIMSVESCWCCNYFRWKFFCCYWCFDYVGWKLFMLLLVLW